MEMITCGVGEHILKDDNAHLCNLGRLILEAQRIHEESWVYQPEGQTLLSVGHYAKDHYQAAVEACGGEGFYAQLIYWLNATCWNDIQEWANHVQGKNYVFNEQGDYTAPDGRCYTALGTEIILDEPEAEVPEHG